jgi:exo-1,4-beta-D-glucosaminidase
VYNYGDHSVYLTNNTRNPIEKVSVKITVRNSEAEILLDTLIEKINIVEEVTDILKVEIPDVADKLYFLFVEVSDGDHENQNTYWLSTKHDQMEKDPKESSWVYTPTASFANLKKLRNLPAASLSVKTEEAGQGTVKVELKNESDKTSFFNEVILRGEDGEYILPVFWSDNFITLQPGDAKVVTCRLPDSFDGKYNIDIRTINSTIE